MEGGATLHRHPRTCARITPQRGLQAARCAGLHLSYFRHQPNASRRGSLARLQPTCGCRESDCELKHDLGADGFCMQKFFATEAAFRAVLLVFNLLAEFQRAVGFPGYREPATLRTQVLTC